jgi:hypothetical protein
MQQLGNKPAAARSKIVKEERYGWIKDADVSHIVFPYRPVLLSGDQTAETRWRDKYERNCRRIQY